MKSIICGAGVVGQSIAESLSKEDLEVTVIDESGDAIRKISDTLDIIYCVFLNNNLLKFYSQFN